MENGRPACFVRDSPPGGDTNPGPALETSAFRRSRDGRAPMPGDLDLWVDSIRENAERVVRVLRDFGFHGDDVTAAIITSRKQIIRTGFELLRLDSESPQHASGNCAVNVLQVASIHCAVAPQSCLPRPAADRAGGVPPPGPQ